MSIHEEPDDDLKPLPREWYLRVVEMQRRKRARKHAEFERIAHTSVDIREIRAHLRRPRAQPIRAAILWVSGVNRDLLRLRPIETTEFIIQGVGVLIATSLAFVAAYAATGLISETPLSRVLRLFVAVFFAALIMAFDRSIVSQQLLPYRFHPDVLNALYSPTADVKWYDLLTSRVAEGGFWHRAKDLVKLPLMLSIRFAFSILASFIIADLLVIQMFLPAVNQQAQVLMDKRSESEIAEIEKQAANHIKSLETDLKNAQKAYSTDPSVKPLADQISQLDAAIKSLPDIKQAYQDYADAEEVGQPGVPYPGHPEWVSSGEPRCGPRCESARAQVASKTAELSDDITKRADLQASLDSLLATSEFNNTKSQNATNQNETTASRDAKIKEVNDRQNAPVGILIRREALHQLTQMTEPWAPYSSATLAACSPGIWQIPCNILQALFPNTPIGLFVGPIRLMLIIVDTAALWFKIFASLRRRRPYDALVAAIEEADIADSVNRLDIALNGIGESIEERSARRHGGRGHAGAAFLREVRGQSERQRRRMMREIREQLVREQAVKDEIKKTGWARLFTWRQRPKVARGADADRKWATEVPKESTVFDPERT